MIENQKINFRVVRDFGDVINVTFAFLKQNYVELGKSLLYIVGPFMVATQLLSIIFQAISPAANIFSPTFDPYEPQAITSSGLSLLIMPLFYLVSMLASVVGITVVNSFVKIYQEDEHNLNVAAVWEMTKQKIGGMFGTLVFCFVLYMIAIVVMVVPVAFIIAPISLALGDTWLGIALTVLIVSVVIGVGAAYLVTIFSLFFPIKMFENISVFELAKRSRVLIKDNFGHSFGVIMISYILMVILGLVLYIPAGMLTFLGGFHGMASEGTVLLSYVLALGALVSSLGQTLLYAVPLVAINLQYFNLVERKEKAGLLNRIDDLRDEGDDLV